MKRRSVSQDDETFRPRRSKRLTIIADNARRANSHAHASVVSLSSNEDSAQRPLVRRSANANFPQDLIQQVEQELSIMQEYLQNAAECDSNNEEEEEEEDSMDRNLHQEYQQKEPMYHILKFALSEKHFLAEDPDGRIRQEELIQDLMRKTDSRHGILMSNGETNVFGQDGVFVEILAIRGNVLPPRTMSFLSNDTTEEFLVPEPTSSPNPFKKMLLNKGSQVLKEFSGNKCACRLLLCHDLDRMERALCMTKTAESIIEYWMRLLQTSTWDASPPHFHEQLDNVHAAFTFALTFQYDLKSMDVVTLLKKLVLYFSFAMDWPRENCTAKERTELERLAKVVRS